MDEDLNKINLKMQELKEISEIEFFKLTSYIEGYLTAQKQRGNRKQ